MADPSEQRREMRRLTSRQRVALVTGLGIAWAIHRVGFFDGEVLNTRGAEAFGEFWLAVFDPATAGDFIRLTIDAATVTIAYAVLGTAVALLIGLVGAPLLSERTWTNGPGRWLRRVATAVFVLPRAVHEIVWALLLLQVFGFDPWVAIIAIGLPFGAVTAKVFAETIDEADQRPFDLARATGAGRIAALATTTVPAISGELVSYSFYRLECAIRSAAVVGIVGVGGLGFQLDLSFESLRYDEIWTIIAALVLVSGLADAWSSTVRRSNGARARVVRRWSVAVAVLLLGLSWRWVGLDVSTLWSERTRRLARETAADLWPPTLGPGGWSEVVDATVETLAMSIVALVLATVFGVIGGAIAARPTGELDDPGLLRAIGGWAMRSLLLLARAVPAPLWAFVVVLVIFPGPIPGAIALGVYNAGVIGRLVAEVIEERPSGSHDLAIAAGAPRTVAFLAIRLPEALGRIIAIALYRWEVIVRETVVVGVVGAGGLGQLIADHLAARDFDAVAGAIVAMLAIAIVVDQLSRTARRAVAAA